MKEVKSEGRDMGNHGEILKEEELGRSCRRDIAGGRGVSWERVWIENWNERAEQCSSDPVGEVSRNVL